MIGLILKLGQRTGLAATLAVGLVALGPLPASAQACLGNREIQEAVAAGEIASLDQVLARAGIDSSQSILSVQVCDEGGQLVYVIGVLSPAGDAQTITVGAR